MKNYRSEALVAGILIGLGAGLLVTAYVISVFLTRAKELGVVGVDYSIVIKFIVAGIIIAALGITTEVYFRTKIVIRIDKEQ